MANSTTRGVRSGTPNDKPKKPSKNFPLFRHATGRWAKKVKGKFRYFGKVADDPHGQAALEKWLEQKDDLLAGRTPRAKTEGLTIKELLNRFRSSKKLAADKGEITPRVFAEYHRTMDRIRDTFGLTRLVTDLTATDFEQLRAVMAKTMGLTAMKTEILKTRAIFNYAYNQDLIDRPVRFGDGFKTPSKKALDRQRGQKGSKMFEPAEVHKLLAESCPAMQTMILLACNCGFGNNDLATLPWSAVDLASGWVTHARPKTGAPRRAKLWPETVEALRKVRDKNRKPLDPADADLVFITEHGQRYARFNGKAWTDGIQSVFTATMHRAGLRKPGRGFYAFRHGFETVGGETADQVAVNYIMGHVDGTMAETYREKRPGDDRLEKIAAHVHKWLFGAKAPASQTQ